MEAIFLKAFHFRQESTVETKIGERFPVFTKECVIQPKWDGYRNAVLIPQTIPSWVAETELFRLAVGDGSIKVFVPPIVVKPVVAAPVVVQETTKAAVPKSVKVAAK